MKKIYYMNRYYKKSESVFKMIIAEILIISITVLVCMIIMKVKADDDSVISVFNMNNENVKENGIVNCIKTITSKVPFFADIVGQTNDDNEKTVDAVSPISRIDYEVINEVIVFNDYSEETAEKSFPDINYSYIKPPEDVSYPVKDAFLTDGFGYRVNPVNGKGAFHNGIDIGGVKAGTEIVAVMSGKVKKVSYDSKSGNYIILQHEDGFTSCYCHLSKCTVNNGDIVYNGQKIGEVGATGEATGPHLHLNMRKDGAYLNPMNYLDYRPNDADNG